MWRWRRTQADGSRTKQKEVRGAPEKNNCDWKRTELREKSPLVYLAPFRSAILQQMLVFSLSRPE